MKIRNWKIPLIGDNKDELSLELSRGEIIFILGANGTGKSTLLQRLKYNGATFISPDRNISISVSNLERNIKYLSRIDTSETRLIDEPFERMLCEFFFGRL